MSHVRIGRRLAVVLLLAVTPVVAIYTYWGVQWSRQNYLFDLKREARATARGLAPVIADYIQHGQWEQARKTFERMSADGTKGALLKPDGALWYAVSGFPDALVARAAQGLNSEAFEFEQAADYRVWFCRVAPLDPGKGVGYLLIAQDWSNIGENLRERMLPPIGAALIVIALVALLIPILVRRYVSKPLDELSRKVVRLSSEEELARVRGQDEVKAIGDEFLKLDRQLTQAHFDLLERHRYELELDRRLQRADRLATIGTLASGLAHEIGTPMGVIRTRTELLLQGNPTAEKIREGLEITLTQIDRISRIVRMLLDYARGRESHRARYDMRAIIDHVIKLVEAQAKRSRVRIIAETGERPLMVECDADRLQQVFVNLAVNAFDAMDPNGGTMKVSAAIYQKAHGKYILDVIFEDSGPGVAPEARGHLFDPFFTTKPPGKGAGMGLAVSQSIMRDHGGDITYEADAQGARFHVTLPMQSADASQAAQTRRAEITSS